MKKKPFNQRIVTLGGGTGHFSLLRGLVEYNNPELITAVVGSWDSGGSSGKLRTEMGVLPPGDIRQCLLALMEDPLQRQVAQKLFDDRLTEVTGPLKGHSVGNLIAARLDHLYKGPDRGTEAERLLFRIRGRVLPVSLTELDLVAKLEDGSEVEGETNIDLRSQKDKKNLSKRITRVFFDSVADPNPEAITAISEADKIIFSAGDLYTSVLPHILVNGIREAIVSSKAKLVLVLNLMSKGGETDGYLASDFLKTFLRYLEDKDRINYMVANSLELDQDILKIYEGEKQHPVKVDKDECVKVAPKLKIIQSPLAVYHLKDHLLRHDPDILAKTVLKLD